MKKIYCHCHRQCISASQASQTTAKSYAHAPRMRSMFRARPVFLDGCNCPQPPVPDNAAHTRPWCQVLGRVKGGASRQPELAHKSPRRSPTHSIASLGASGILPVSVSVQLRSDTRQCGCWPLRTWTFDVDVAGTSRVPMGVGQSRLLPPAKSCHGGTQGGLRTGRIS